MSSLIIALVVMTGVALLLLSLPLLRVPKSDDNDRQQQNIDIAKAQMQQLEIDKQQGLISATDYQQSMETLEAALARDLQSQQAADQLKQGDAAAAGLGDGRWMVVLIALALPALAAVMYWQLGQPQMIELLAQQSNQPTEVKQLESATNMSIDEMIDRVKAKLRANPEDADGWFILGRTYMTLQRYEEASVAYARTYELVGDEPAVMLAYADAIAMTNNGQIDAVAADLILRAQKLAPENPTALWLAGLVAEQQKNYDQARAYWTQLLPLMSDDPGAVQEVRSLIAGLPGTTEEQLQSLDSQLSEAPSGPSLSLEVSLSEELRAKVSADDSVFVYAKAQSGPPMPLAAQRLKVSDLPAKVTLNESMAMIPNMTIAAFDTLIVGARVSKSGQAIARSGDLIGEVEGISNQRSEPLSIEINAVVP